MSVNFDVSKGDLVVILDIVARSLPLLNRVLGSNTEHQRDMLMDLIACHANGTPLRLADLLNANEADFAHDIFGIRRHIDRETGRLNDCFRPRFSLRVA